jgi:hypothetical protein
MPDTQINVVIPVAAGPRLAARKMIENRLDSALPEAAAHSELVDNLGTGNLAINLTDVPDEQIAGIFRMLANLALRPESGIHRPAINGYNPIPHEQREFTA